MARYSPVVRFLPTGDWTRAAAAVGLAFAAVLISGAVLPAMVVPSALVGLFGGSMLVDHVGDDRDSRKRVAHRSGLLVFGLVAATWTVFTEHSGPTCAVLACSLGAGAGVAALGVALIGMDARNVLRG